ncbi:phosphatidylglycerophosphatase A [Pusillimonas sp.]|uniref:phosphatidylglycerophosphatase A n=1 Tax=Pusillimonas sp. TaxID=3040095 RepID=UPI0037C78B3A
MPTIPPESSGAGPAQSLTLKWVFRSPARAVAFGLGSGLLRPAPGTWGTALGWLLWVLVVSRLSDVGIAAVLAGSFAYGCWACHKVGKELGRADDSAMVWDEIVAFWLVLWLMPEELGIQAVAFVIFRLFDIIKPPPIRYFDKKFKNGLGVMWDDILAAAYSLLVLAVLVRLEVL